MYLYLCKMSDPTGGEEFYKVGVSQSPYSRFKWGATKVIDSDMSLSEKLDKVVAGERYVSDHPYDTETIYHVEFRHEGEAYLRERGLLADLKTSQYWPSRKFSGRSECFRCDDETLKIIMQYMDAAAAEAKESELSELQYKVSSIGVRETDKIARHLAILENYRKRQ
jgi:hypothetical protein